VPDLGSTKIVGEVAMLKVVWVVNHWEFGVESILKRKVDDVHPFALQQMIVWNLLSDEPIYKWEQ
jgi:hypothetical protein